MNPFKKKTSFTCNSQTGYRTHQHILIYNSLERQTRIRENNYPLYWYMLSQTQRVYSETRRAPWRRLRFSKHYIAGTCVGLNSELTFVTLTLRRLLVWKCCFNQVIAAYLAYFAAQASRRNMLGKIMLYWFIKQERLLPY